MGRLSSHDERPTDHTGQSDRVHTGRGWRNLATTDGQVTTSGDGVGGQGCLWDRTTGRWRGGKYRGRHSCHACFMSGTLTGRGMGFYPH